MNGKIQMDKKTGGHNTVGRTDGRYLINASECFNDSLISFNEVICCDVVTTKTV